MRRPIDCLVVMPVGPRSQPGHVFDSVDAFLHYMPAESTVLLVLDDSRDDVIRAMLPTAPCIRYVSATALVPTDDGEHNTRGALLLKQWHAVVAATADFDWRCLMRLDDDALLIGRSPHLEALSYYKANPDVGMLGAFRRRGDGSSKGITFGRQRRRYIRQIFSRHGLRQPSLVLHLLKVWCSAAKAGHRLGGMCEGGALFLSRAACDEIHDRFGAQRHLLRGCRLADDVLLSTYTAAAGFGIADFSDPDDVLAVNWRGLPMPLDELVRRNKRVVHPVKDPADPEHEVRVRDFFRARRATV
jgi:hypothetical protein